MFLFTGLLRYANNSNYKNDVMIRKEVFVGDAVLKELERIVTESEIMAEDDHNWPEKDRVGSQELEIVSGNSQICFECRKIGALSEVEKYVLFTCVAVLVAHCVRGLAVCASVRRR